MRTLDDLRVTRCTPQFHAASLFNKMVGVVENDVVLECDLTRKQTRLVASRTETSRIADLGLGF
jgi:hypothetical protein